MTSWIDITGSTLLHFVWQGALIALTAGAALRVLRGHSPQVRYTVGCVGLALMLASPLITARALTSDAVSARATSAVGTYSDTTPARLRPTSDTVSGTTSGASSGTTSGALLGGVVALWTTGVALLLVQLAGGGWRVRRLHAASWRDRPSPWQHAGDGIADRLGLSRAVRIVDSAAVATPTVIGWMRPVVLLPVAALATLTPAQVEAILAHELAHIRRHDFLVNVLQTIAETLLFYHPAVWWLSRRIRTEREHCCDDIAVSVCGDPYGYAAALTEIAALHATRTPLALAATGGSLSARVRRLLGVQPQGAPRSASALMIFSLAIAIVVAGGGVRWFVVAQAADSDAVSRGFGPPDLNRLVGFELLPGATQFPTDDPIDARAWFARVYSGETEMSFVGFGPRSLIRQAYGLAEMPIVNAPAWMDRETFDLAIPSSMPVVVNGLSDEQIVNAAIRQYFEQELDLAWHHETREFPAYALVRTGGPAPNLRPSTSDCRFCGVDDNLFGFDGRNVTMAQLAERMAARHSPIAIGRDVIDRTGLTGAYDFELRLGFLPFAAIAHNRPALQTLLQPAGIRSFFTALPEQLGLRLEDTTLSRQVLVIDHIDKPS